MIDPDRGDNLKFRTNVPSIDILFISHIGDDSSGAYYLISGECYSFDSKSGILMFTAKGKEELKTFSDGRYSLFFIAERDKSLHFNAFKTTFVISRGRATAPSASSDVKTCTHPNMGWDVVREATDTDDGEMKCRCPDCGYVSEVRPITVYWQFNADAAKAIANAKSGAEVSIDTPLFVSFHHSVIEQLQKQPDVSVALSFRYRSRTSDKVRNL
jgi:hypothetical protein